MRIFSSRRSRLLTATAVAGVAALALAGCTADNSDKGASDGGGGGTISIAVTNLFTSLNGDTPQGNVDTNGMVGYLTGVSGGLGLGSFVTLDPSYELVKDDSFGTYEKVSDDPLTVKYTLNDDLKWSDGEPITADDMLFSWVVNSGWFDDATIDPATGEATSGTQYFSLAGSTTGLDTTKFPEISDDNLSLTIEYSEPFVDWELVNMMGKPAHVAADHAGISLEEMIKLFKETPQGDPENPVEPNETLKKIADFWNTGYDVTSMPEDESLLVSSGPFIVSDFTPEQSITLEKNPEYTGDNEPAYDKLIMRFIGDTNAQITALQNGEVNAIYPQPSADTITALEKMNAELLQGDQVSYDHLDLNFGSEVFQDPKVREAFLKTVPRKQILDSIITPINDKAEVLNSQIFLPANKEYKDAVAASGYDAFDEADIDGAKELLDGATPTVKILYNSENPNRVDSFQAIKNSAEKAGFKVEDGGSKDWGTLLSGGDYDASIFGWISPGIGSAGLPQIFHTGGGGNYNSYSNSTVDDLVDQSQVTLDPAKLAELKIKIDAETAKDFYGLPLFQLPGLFASNGTVDGLEYMGNQTGIVWNAQDWTLTK